MKKIELPDCLYSFAGFSKDSNGNSVAKFINETTGKGFSVQTNQNLPKTHSMRSEDLKDLTDKDLEVIKKELLDYVKDNGTPAMKTDKKEDTIKECIIEEAYKRVCKKDNDNSYVEQARKLILGGLNLKEAKNKLTTKEVANELFNNKGFVSAYYRGELVELEVASDTLWAINKYGKDELGEISDYNSLIKLLKDLEKEKYIELEYVEIL